MNQDISAIPYLVDPGGYIPQFPFSADVIEISRKKLGRLLDQIVDGTDVAVETADIILVRSNPLDAAAILRLSKATYRKMIQNLIWATGYNAFAIPLAAGVLAGAGIVLGPALGAVLMSLSTVIVAINARFLKVER